MPPRDLPVSKSTTPKSAGGNIPKSPPGPFAAVTSFQAGSIPCDVTERNPVRLACLRAESTFLSTLGLAQDWKTIDLLLSIGCQSPQQSFEVRQPTGNRFRVTRWYEAMWPA